MRFPVVLGPRALVPHCQEGQEQLLRGNQVGYSIILLGIMNGPIRRMFHTEYLAKNIRQLTDIIWENIRQDTGYLAKSSA